MAAALDAAFGSIDPGTVAKDVSAYYAQKFERHGPGPRGVDWSCQPTQELRFIQLLRICALDTPFSLNDLGCGYGALRAFLHRRHWHAQVDYLGIDLCESMIDSARLRLGHLPQTRFDSGSALPRGADYSIASGLFNVRLHHPIATWEAWVAHVLDQLHAASRIGFAINFLAPPRPGESSPRQLYRPSLERWQHHCVTRLQATVDPVVGYGMLEYTLLVRKNGAADAPITPTRSSQ